VYSGRSEQQSRSRGGRTALIASAGFGAITVAAWGPLDEPDDTVAVEGLEPAKCSRHDGDLPTAEQEEHRASDRDAGLKPKRSHLEASRR
jgi:hypothetical protein